jgi:hypothetical protein
MTHIQREPQRLGDILKGLEDTVISEDLPGIRLFQQLMRRIRLREQGIDPDEVTTHPCVTINATPTK